MDTSSATAIMQAITAHFTDTTRLYALEGDGPLSELMVERWSGRESLSGGFELHIDVLSMDAALPLQAMLGQPVALRITLADGSRIRRHGLVREASLLGADGGLARYRLSVVPWTWLLSQGRHSRVFQEQPVLDIVQRVFADYAPLANWRLSDELGPFMADRRPRSYCVQYRETDAAFVDRLLAEEGIGTRIEADPDAARGRANGASAGRAGAAADVGHTLVLFADSRQLPDAPASAAHGGIRFHRSHATEASDTIQTIGSHSRLAPTSVTVLSHDYKSGRATSASLPLADNGDDSTQRELYDPAGPWAYATAAEAEHYATLHAQAIEARHNTWVGRGSVRDLRAGVGFTLLDAPGDAPPELIVTRIEHIGINNLPDAAQQHLAARLGTAPPPAHVDDTGASAPDPHVLARAEAVGYGNRFSAIARDLPWRPALTDDTGLRLNPRPTAPGPQTAIVTGPDGATTAQGHHAIHTDRLGRIRARFHWQTGEGAQDTCWLRVMQRHAGPGGGTHVIPRIGQEVLVQFLGGDIDRPLVMGTLYNGQGEAGIAPTPGGMSATADTTAYAEARDHSPSAQGNLAGGMSPPWHAHGGGDAAHRHAGALSGLRTGEFGGRGHNQLLLDDSDRQGRVQMATTQAASELNLGHLIHTADNYRGSFRGTGFELRTDAWGAVRATAGLLLSTYGAGDSAPAGDATGPTALLRQHVQLANTLSDTAKAHHTVQLAAHTGLEQADQSILSRTRAPLTALLDATRSLVDASDWPKAQASTAEPNTPPGKDALPHSRAPVLTLAGRGGIGLLAGQALHLAAGETLNLASGQDTNMVINGDARIHSGQAIGWLAGAQAHAKGRTGMDLIATKDDVAVQAQHDAMALRAKRRLTMQSASADIAMAAKKTVHMAVSGGASLTIEGGNLTFACPGTLTVHASKKMFTGATKLDRSFTPFPGHVCVECLLRAAEKVQPFVAR